TMYRPAEIAKVVRLADVALLVGPTRVLDIDVVDRLESALPELGGHRSQRLHLADAPFLRAIVLTGDATAPWATQVDDGQSVPPAV
ncbi:long-chain fatty acid--CoA ligase, partial [Mycobacterium sp. ITM-2017-0098]